MTDWPSHIDKPDLPPGYSWSCLKQAIGLKNPDSTHPWYIRVTWVMKNGKSRFLNMGQYFETPQQAIAHAVLIACDHARKKENGDG